MLSCSLRFWEPINIKSKDKSNLKVIKRLTGTLCIYDNQGKRFGISHVHTLVLEQGTSAANFIFITNNPKQGPMLFCVFYVTY